MIPKEGVDSASVSKMPDDLIGLLCRIVKSMGSSDFWLMIRHESAEPVPLLIYSGTTASYIGALSLQFSCIKITNNRQTVSVLALSLRATSNLRVPATRPVVRSRHLNAIQRRSVARCHDLIRRGAKRAD